MTDSGNASDGGSSSNADNSEIEIGNGSGSGSGGGDSGGGRSAGGEDGDDGPSTVEKVGTAVSVLFTLLLFAFLLWQALHGPAEATPEAHVESVEELPGNRTAVTVVVRNPGNRGLLAATVAVDCTQPPPSVDFTHVPTDGMQRAVIVCPAGTVDDATANVTKYQTA